MNIEAGGGQYQRPSSGQATEEAFQLPGCPDNAVENPLVLGSTAACLVFFAIFSAFSLGAVPPLTYGIRYNLFNKQADIDNPHGPGRYFICPWNTFLLFPASVQTIEFTGEPRLAVSGLRFPALHSRTKEGLALHLQVSLQYQLKFDQVGKLYKEFNRDYEQMFTSVIRDTLIRAASDYEAYQLWEERADVGEKMQGMVDRALKRTYADCWGLQLMIIELPDLFERSIVKTQVNMQTIASREYQKEATRVKAQTSVIAAEYQRKVKVIKANGRANYTYVTKAAKAHARKNTLTIEGKIMKSVKDNLGLSTGDLVTYQRFTALQALPNASLLFGFEANTQVLMTPNSPSPAAQAPAPPPPPTDGSGPIVTPQVGTLPRSLHEDDEL